MSSPADHIIEYVRLKTQGSERLSVNALEDARQAIDQAREILENLYQAEHEEILDLLSKASHELCQKYLGLGDACVKESNLDQAKEHFKTAQNVASARQDREDAEIRLGQIDQREAPSESLEGLLKKLKDNPESPVALYDFATILALEGYLPEAIQNLQRLTEMTPGDGDVYYRLGNACFDARRYDEAAAAYEKALSIGFEDKAEIHYRQGRLVFHQHADHSMARRQFRRALDENPKHLDTLRGLGHLNELEENDEDAIQLFLRAVEIDPGDMEVRIKIVELYRRLGQFEAATEACKAALKADPGSDLVDDLKDQLELIQNEESESRERGES